MPESQEEFKISGAEAKEKIKDFFATCNRRTIVVTNEKQEVVLRLSLIWAIVITVIFPWLTVIGVAIAILSRCSIALVKNNFIEKK